MGSRMYQKLLLCMGAATLFGVLGGKDAGAEQRMGTLLLTENLPVVQSSYFQINEIKNIWRAVGAAHPYIEGLEDVGERALQRIAEAKKTGEIMLLSKTKGLEGTRVYANVSNYVNVRKGASASTEALGKLYAGCVATVIEEEGNWVYVSSGNVTGYVVKDYLLFGEEAETAIAKQYSPKVQVTANVLNVRAGAGTGYDVLTTFAKGDEAELITQGKEWTKIRLSVNGKKKTGYVASQYVTVVGEPKYGETLAEEKERIAAEKKAAAEAAAKAEAEKKAAIEQAKRDKAAQVANYAKTAVGKPYVWGGTNLSAGVDCSGLCYAAYKAYGYTLPRVSRDMAASSALLSVKANTNSLKAGDLVFYASGGRVDHVAMYIGNGKVVHASDYSTGVIISNYNYRTPHSAKRVIY